MNTSPRLEQVHTQKLETPHENLMKVMDILSETYTHAPWIFELGIPRKGPVASQSMAVIKMIKDSDLWGKDESQGDIPQAEPALG